MGISAKLVLDVGTVPDPYSLKSDWTTDFFVISELYMG